MSSQVIREREALVMSDRDRDMLLQLLDKKPGRPAAALFAALGHHARLVRET